MYQLMNKLVDRVYNVQLVCCMHMALLGTNLLIKHEELLKKISQRIVDEISHSRIKVAYMTNYILNNIYLKFYF